MAKCNQTTRAGRPCRATALPGKDVCMFHDPEHAEVQAEARRRGGTQRSRPAVTLPPDTPDLPLETVADVIKALASTFNAVRCGRLDARVGNCLFVGAGVLLKAIEGGDLERRIAALEEGRITRVPEAAA